MTRIIDISVPVQPGMVLWPDTEDVQLETSREEVPDGNANISRLSLDVHSGTHVDAPFHFIQQGKRVEALSLDILIGPVFVVELPEVQTVTASDLKNADIPTESQRLLIKTQNSNLWEQRENGFREDFVALAVDAALWIVERGIRLVGIDYLSIQRYHDGPEVHHVLLGAEVVVVETLDLSKVSTGWYELYCLPLKLVGAEGAPARVILQTIDEQ